LHPQRYPGANDELSFSRRCLFGVWDKRSYYYFSNAWQAVADHYKFDLTKPIKELGLQGPGIDFIWPAKARR